MATAVNSWLERLADPAEAKRIVAAWHEGWRVEKRWFRDRNIARDEATDPKREDTPLELVDRTNCDRLFNLKREHFPRELAESLGYYLKRWKRSAWMRDQRGYFEKAALAVSSRSNFDGLRYCNCRPGRL